MDTDHGRARITAPGDEPWLTHDLLVIGYLSAVARELEDRGVAESRLRIDPPDDHQLAGSLHLEPTSCPRWSSLVTLHWHETSGWSALLHHCTATADAPAAGRRCGPPRGWIADRRYLHPDPVPHPEAVAEFVAELATGRDTGMIYPTDANDYGHARSRARVIATLTRFALPEVRRWLIADSPPQPSPASDPHRPARPGRPRARTSDRTTEQSKKRWKGQLQ
ncbi:DUF6292 family protein [Pseudonocardia kunmingensis]|uniref:DUF6292 domain-containing protein n=1 Tax=Pseudonocardia kunmingensis TaxID=630975 RepID=A0A543CY46_9PSEU|nr:DUF6292 family protein [Pseudonocardia kunmingensis]TQM01788.1 hypothetical protein FB558_8303 [Pseudonocardia kunmingensis]